jgi:hypothetical protein
MLIYSKLKLFCGSNVGFSVLCSLETHANEFLQYTDRRMLFMAHFD